MPRVSVVMGVRNDPVRLRHSVAGILAQTMTDFELLVIDDGSTDETAAVLQELADSDNRIRVVRQETSGLTVALMRGCELANAPIIARQDADDWSYPDRLAMQLEVLDADAKVGLVTCDTEYVGPADEHLDVVRRPADSHEYTRRLLHDKLGPPAHGSTMFRVSDYRAVGGYRRAFYYSQDSDLWLRLCERSRVAHVHQVLYRHRKDPDSISGAKREVQGRFSDLAHACKHARNSGQSELSFLSEAEALRDEISLEVSLRTGRLQGSLDIAYLIGSQLARNGDRRAARYLWRVIRHRPAHLKAWIRMAQSLLLRRVRSEG